VVDEVLAVGDAEFQKKCLGKMSEVAQGGRTVLFVSHNMGAVERLCSRAIFLRDGTVADDDESARVISRYQASIHLGDEAGLAYVVDRELLDKGRTDTVAITDLVLLSRDEEPLKVLHTGDGFILRICYESTTDFRSPAFRVQIKGHLGEELVRLNTMPISGFPIENLAPQGHIDLVVESLPFTAGLYYFNVGIARERREWVVRLDDVLMLTVSPKDVYGSGMLLDNTRGHVVLRHHWQHGPESSRIAAEEGR
jgi:lipopolysaccharide transport system ATP-binding protein